MFETPTNNTNIANTTTRKLNFEDLYAIITSPYAYSYKLNDAIYKPK